MSQFDYDHIAKVAGVDRQTVKKVLFAASRSGPGLAPDCRSILLNLCGSAGLADHMGDMAEDIWQALKQAEIEPPEGVNSLSQLGAWLGMVYGATTIWGTDLTDDGDVCTKCWLPAYICERCDNDA